jgi:hypothetical protein
LEYDFIDFSKLPDKYGRDNFVGITMGFDMYFLSWEDLIKCWDGNVRFYFDEGYVKVDDIFRVVVKDDFGCDDVYNYVTTFLQQTT